VKRNTTLDEEIIGGGHYMIQIDYIKQALTKLIQTNFSTSSEWPIPALLQSMSKCPFSFTILDRIPLKLLREVLKLYSVYYTLFYFLYVL
jgi:hypothetical protein